VLYYVQTHNNNDRFTALCPGLPEWAGTRRNTHPSSWSSSNLYQLLPSTTIHSILLVQITCLAIFTHNLFPCPLWSTSGDKWQTFLGAVCPSCHPTNSVKELKKIQSLAWPHPFFVLHRLPNGRGAAPFMLALLTSAPIIDINYNHSAIQWCSAAGSKGRYGSFHTWINVCAAGKTVWSLMNTCQPEWFRDEYLTHHKALYKRPVYLLFTNPDRERRIP